MNQLFSRWNETFSNTLSAFSIPLTLNIGLLSDSAYFSSNYFNISFHILILVLTFWSELLAMPTRVSDLGWC